MNPNIFTEAVKAAFVFKLGMSIVFTATIVIIGLLMLSMAVSAIRGNHDH